MDKQTTVKERYERNMEAFSAEELGKIASKKIAVIGCGGLGGHVISSLARFGVGSLMLVDGDVFAESNLNRQIFSNLDTLGINKAEATKAAVERINPDVELKVFPSMMTEENAGEILAGCDLAMDCLDNISARFILEKKCLDLGIPFVYGAIGGLYAQVAVIFPGDDLLSRIYPFGENMTGVEKKLGNPSFTPQLAAAVQCSEALKLLAGRDSVLRNEMLYIDLVYNSFEIIGF